MSTPRDPHDTSALEDALRREAAARREGPAPHVVPRVLATVERETARSASEARVGPASRRAVVVGPLLALAATVCLVLLLRDDATSPATTEVPLVDAESPTAAPSPPHAVPASSVPGASPTGPVAFVGPPLHELPRSPVAPLERALGDSVEQPLLRELDDLAVDAQRAAALVVEPLLRALVDLQLRPSMDRGWDGG